MHHVELAILLVASLSIVLADTQTQSNQPVVPGSPFREQLYSGSALDIDPCIHGLGLGIRHVTLTHPPRGGCDTGDRLHN